MNHKLIVVFDGFESEDHARLFATFIQSSMPEYTAKVYVVQDESEDT